jgi:hypothetical protein
MNRDQAIEVAIGAIAAATTSAGVVLAIRVGLDGKDIANALFTFAGVALGVFGATWSAIYVANRRRYAECDAVVGTLCGLKAAIASWRDNIPQPDTDTGDEALEKLIETMDFCRDHVESAVEYAIELNFLQRAILVPWLKRFADARANLAGYYVQMAAFRTGNAADRDLKTSLATIRSELDKMHDDVFESVDDIRAAI